MHSVDRVGACFCRSLIVLLKWVACYSLELYSRVQSLLYVFVVFLIGKTRNEGDYEGSWQDQADHVRV